MTAVGKLVLVLGLLVSARCEVRARDPEVEEDEEEEVLGGGRAAKPHPTTTEAPPLGERETGHKLNAHKLKTSTVLPWPCCKGPGGDSEATDPDAQLDFEDSDVSGGSDPEKPATDWSREQSDHHASQAHDTSSPTRKPEPRVADAADVVSYPEATAALPVPHMMALVMSQLQPVLEGFNRSLEHLSLQLGVLARDVAALKSSQEGLDLQLKPLDEAAEQHLDIKLEEALQQIADIRTEMETQQTELENRLHSQNAMLHYNVTAVKMDVDLKLQQHQTMLQVSLQAMNASLSELQLDQDPLEDHDAAASLPPPQQLSDSSTLWEAIERLDNVVVNTTVKVSGLVEDADVTSGSVQRLERDLEELRERVRQTGRNAQIQYMMTGLEVEEAKVTVLQRVNELAANLTLQDKRLQDVDVDVDYIYTILYKNSSSADCGALKASVAQLQEDVTSASRLANDNRLVLEENSRAEEERWRRVGSYTPALEALQLGLQQVKDALVSEQDRTRSLNNSLTQLSGSVTVSLAEVSGLKHTNRQLWEETQTLSGSFTALLKDASRHNDVLELLLGEEVLEFMEWPKQDQEAYSIPALKQQLRISALQPSGAGAREELPSSSHHPTPGAEARTSSGPARERQFLGPEQGRVSSDLRSLEKMLEDGISTGSEATLEAEVLWLKRGLEHHLSVFKNVFSNADVLTRSSHTLELDRLWELVNNKDGRKDKKRGGNRSRRKPADGLSDVALQFVARSPQSISDSAIAFKPALNQGRFHPQSSSFTAPVGGAYLFILTLDLRPGPVHVVLRRRSGGSPVSLHHTEVLEAGPCTGVGLLLLRGGEEVRLERRRGAWLENQDNVFAGLLLHRTT